LALPQGLEAAAIIIADMPGTGFKDSVLYLLHMAGGHVKAQFVIQLVHGAGLLVIVARGSVKRFFTTEGTEFTE
jgi:molybdopterin-binding protein